MYCYFKDSALWNDQLGEQPVDVFTELWGLRSLRLGARFHGNLCLDRMQRDLGLGHLARFFGMAVTCLLSPHSQVVAAATQTLKVPQSPQPSLSWGKQST